VFLDCGDFGISFNPAAGFLGLSMFAQDSDDGETAIVLGSKYPMHNPFLILNGDFRRELAECADNGGLEACIEFFAGEPLLHSSWSNTADEARAALAPFQGGES
jgi:hypothetical protein